MKGDRVVSFRSERLCAKLSNLGPPSQVSVISGPPTPKCLPTWLVRKPEILPRIISSGSLKPLV